MAITITILTIRSATITTSPVNAVYNSDADLVITLKDEQGNPLANAPILVYITDLKSYSTDANGQAKVSTKGLAANTYEASIIFVGNENYTGSVASEKITINPLPCELTVNGIIITTYNVNKNLVISLKDSNGNALSGVEVNVNLGSDVKYTTDKNGQIKVNVAIGSENLYCQNKHCKQ